MNPRKCDEDDCINLLIAAQQVYSSVEAPRTDPAETAEPAHDAYTRLLQRVLPYQLSKNDHFEAMIHQAHACGFTPTLALFEVGIAASTHKLLCSLRWLTQLKSNCQVSIDRSGTQAVSEILIPAHGCQVHL